ncbi:MAG: hypothetical protein F6K10_36290 [Moorea sp. SIO2B7]|nr:hypothetical protein [Moorena sp. SIO2B7]
MVERLKRWESPRRQGRNKKGKGGSARMRQLKKQQQMLRKKLQGSPESKKQNKKSRGREIYLFPNFLDYFSNLVEAASAINYDSNRYQFKTGQFNLRIEN